MPNLGARLLVAAVLLLPSVTSSPILDVNNGAVTNFQSEDGSDYATPPQHDLNQPRKLQGRFLHITDFHPDAFYKPYTSTQEGIACHRKKGTAGAYGAETTECDSPLSLVDATLDWVRTNLKDQVDFVVWTGDTARHDSDEKIPRNKSDVLGTNQLVSQKMVDAFSDDGQLTIPIIPTFGNNDFLPHNIFYQGPNKWLQAYSEIWHRFIPEEQRHSFGFGGWFEVEVIPDKLSVFSLNTMYFFDRNAGVDGCADPLEPGFKHLEWLSIQLQRVRERGMKAMLIGHVPPARTESKQNWDETCWQKYTMWLQQFRDVVAGSFYGHMNIDHFLLQDTKDIDLGLLSDDENVSLAQRGKKEKGFSSKSKSDYLRELRNSWADLPGAVKNSMEDDDREEVEDEDFEELGKKHRKKKKKHGHGLKKIGGKYGERYQLSLISPSVVPNFFPTLRVVEYNITGIEDSPLWTDSFKSENGNHLITPELWEADDEQEQVRLELKRDLSAEGKKKRKKGKKGHKKKPTDPNLVIPPEPPKDSIPGPAYLPQAFTLTGYTQYFANLTHINNQVEDTAEGDLSNESLENDKPKPREFKYEIEYSTFTDKVYKLRDLTVRSYLKLAYRIGKQELEGVSTEEIDEIDELNEDDNDDTMGSEDETSAERQDKKKKKKKEKNKKPKEKLNKTWRQFVRRAFVSTISEKELKKLTE
ncbi:Metallo-dependent phosphatase-like protein [Mariannaea sp. PMI_226]|nr:Metallo-dependent phosphatase-like protein [Mariannaea sp. PMI_226]